MSKSVETPGVKKKKKKIPGLSFKYKEYGQQMEKG